MTRPTPTSLAESDAWQLRTAFVGRDQDARLAAMRRLWAIGKGPLEREASRALVARAATRIAPRRRLQSDAPDLIASMLAAGYDREAARWAGAVRRMDDEPADACWAMLALAAPSAGIDTSFGRINAFAGRDDSKGRRRTRLAGRGSGRARPDRRADRGAARQPLRPRPRPAVALDADDRRRGQARPGRDGQSAGGDRHADERDRRRAGIASVPCGRGDAADRAGIHRRE